MSNSAMSTLASQVPIDIEELATLGILGENVVQEYGERLVKSINSFVQQNGLQEYVIKHTAKRSKTIHENGASHSFRKSSSGIEIAPTDEDEYDCGVDFSAIELP